MKHTTGPWKAITAQRGFIVTAHDGVYDIAVVRDIGNEDNAANARLIASAPDLLGALQAMIDWNPGTQNKATDMARAAIAKATGCAA